MSDGSHERPAGPAPKIESAADRVLGSALRTGQSPFEDDLYTWTPEVAEELARRLDSDPEADRSAAAEPTDSHRSPVMQALHDQLEGAPRPVILLAAELLYIQQLPLSTVTAPPQARPRPRHSVLDR